MNNQQAGVLIETVRGLSTAVEKLDGKMDKVLQFQAATEERLASGSRHFDKHENQINAIAATQVADCEKITEINVRCANECAKRPSGRLVYGLITIGFVILALLVSIGTWHKPVAPVEMGKVIK